MRAGPTPRGDLDAHRRLRRTRYLSRLSNRYAAVGVGGTARRPRRPSAAGSASGSARFRRATATASSAASPVISIGAGDIAGERRPRDEPLEIASCDRIGRREPIAADAARAERGEEGEELVAGGRPPLADGDPAARANDAGRLGEGQLRIQGVLHGVERGDDVKRAVGPRQALHQPQPEIAARHRSSAAAIASGSQSTPCTIAPRRAAKAQNAPLRIRDRAARSPSPTPAASATASQAGGCSTPEARSPRCWRADGGCAPCRTRPSAPPPRESGCRSSAAARARPAETRRPAASRSRLA